MGFKVDVDRESRVVYIGLPGHVAAKDIFGAVVEMESRGVREFDQLWNFTETEGLALGPIDIQELADSAQERQKRYGAEAGKIAMVAENTVYFSVSRLVQHRAERKGVNARVFGIMKLVEEARHWLERG